MEAMKENNALEVERLLTPVKMEVDAGALGDPAAYPVTVTLKRLPAPEEWANGDVKSGLYRSNLFADEGKKEEAEEEEETETVLCKYLVGCDGARSWVRK
jgi:phenol 2-monooxygenase